MIIRVPNYMMKQHKISYHLYKINEKKWFVNSTETSSYLKWGYYTTWYPALNTAEVYFCATKLGEFHLEG